MADRLPSPHSPTAGALDLTPQDLVLFWLVQPHTPFFASLSAMEIKFFISQCPSSLLGCVTLGQSPNLSSAKPTNPGRCFRASSWRHHPPSPGPLEASWGRSDEKEAGGAEEGTWWGLAMHLVEGPSLPIRPASAHLPRDPRTRI